MRFMKTGARFGRCREPFRCGLPVVVLSPHNAAETAVRCNRLRDDDVSAIVIHKITEFFCGRHHFAGMKISDIRVSIDKF